MEIIEADTPYTTVHKWVWPAKKNTPKNGSAGKPLKKKTKPEVKCQLDTVVSSILAGSVSNDTLKARISGLYNLAHIHAWAFLSSNATG